MKKIIAAIVAITIVFALPVFASADNSPSGTEKHKVTVIDVEGGTCEKIENPDGTYTIKATTKGGYEFTGWKIDGQYEFVSGSLSTPTITIKISSLPTSTNPAAPPASLTAATLHREPVTRIIPPPSYSLFSHL